MEELQLNWYALKIFFNKVFEIEEMLERMEVETYLPVLKKELKGQERMQAARRLDQNPEKSDRRYLRYGPLIFQREPILSSLIFVHTDAQTIVKVGEELKGDPEINNPKGFVYRTADWKQYCIIPDHQMRIFRMVVESGAEGLEFFADDDITRFRQGDRVRVKEGPLRGAEGYIRRIHKNRRLLVSIDGVIAVATSYIPPENLEKVQ